MASGPINDDSWGPPTRTTVGWGVAVWPPPPPDWSDLNTAPPNSPTEDDFKYTGTVEKSGCPEKITPSQLRKFLAGETVIIYVGSGKEVFKLSKNLLCYISPFFRAAFEGEFKEGKERTMELLEDNVEAFDHVVSYMYRGIFGNEILHQHQFAGWQPGVKLATVVHLLEFSERLQIPDMQIAALADLVWVLRNDEVTEPTAEDIELAFNLLPTESDAVMHLVDYVADNFLKSEANLDANDFKA